MDWSCGEKEFCRRFRRACFQHEMQRYLLISDLVQDTGYFSEEERRARRLHLRWWRKCIYQRLFHPQEMAVAEANCELACCRRE